MGYKFSGHDNFDVFTHVINENLMRLSFYSNQGEGHINKTNIAKVEWIGIRESCRG